jgi:hypothetical protein
MNNWLETPGFYYGNAGVGMDNRYYRQLVDILNDPDNLGKSLITSDGIVPGGDTTSGRPLRVQFLHNVLETTSYEQDDAIAMKHIPKEKVYSNVFEWSQFNLYGGAGDGFIPETGASTDQSSGLFFGATAGDDTFSRLTKTLKYMAAVRFVSLPMQHVRNIEDPMKASEKGITLEIIAKCNTAIYFGDSRTQQNQFDGIIRQLLDWLTPGTQYGTASFPGHPEDQAIIYDAGGLPIDKAMLTDIQATNRLKWGQGSLLIQSVLGYEDTQKLLYPEQRAGEGTTGTFGMDRRTFLGPSGRIKLADDPMLRINRPLLVDGPASTGAPRLTTTQDTGATTWVGGGANFASCAATAPGNAYFWKNANLNTDPAAIGSDATTTPALPSGDGNQSNHNSTSLTHYYAASIVVNGLESAVQIYGATSPSTTDLFDGSAGMDNITPTGVTITSTNSIVKFAIDASKITGLGSTVLRKNVKIRVYKYAGTAPPTRVSQFQYLMDIGCPASGNPTGFDNGMYIPGTDNAFLITEKKHGVNGWFLAQLLPLMKREGLPELLIASPLAMIYFCAPILLVPRHHMWIRNIGRAS